MTYRTTLAAAFFAVAFFCSVFAAQAAKTEKIEMQSRLWDDASGEATITDGAAGTKEITVKADNLVPNSVFTVWFANEEAGEERESVAAGKNSFRTDANGDGVFTATVPDEKIESWRKIEVGFHPEGDPGNLENVHLALSGDMGEAG